MFPSYAAFVLHSISTSQAKGRRGQQIRGKVLKDESLVQIPHPTAGRRTEESAG